MIDIESLLLPIDQNQRVGQDCRQNASEIYQKIKALRTKVRTLERNLAISEEDNAQILPIWKEIAKLCETILQTQSKDLEVAAWLLEALTRLHGFLGLTEGFNLITQLISQFWPALYPNEDDEGIQSKLSSIIGLNGVGAPGALITPIYCIPLIEQAELIISAWHYQQAISKGQSNQSTMTMSAIEAAGKAKGREYLTQLYQQISLSLQSYDALCQLLKEKLQGEEAPPSSHIRNGLLFCQEAISHLLSKIEPEKVDETKEQIKNEIVNSKTLANNILETREMAFEKLAEIADYFQTHEPCSPVAYLLQQAIRWRDITLPELLAEIIEDPQSLKNSCQMIGLRSPEYD